MVVASLCAAVGGLGCRARIGPELHVSDRRERQALGAGRDRRSRSEPSAGAPMAGGRLGLPRADRARGPGDQQLRQGALQRRHQRLADRHGSERLRVAKPVVRTARTHELRFDAGVVQAGAVGRFDLVDLRCRAGASASTRDRESLGIGHARQRGHRRVDLRARGRAEDARCFRGIGAPRPRRLRRIGHPPYLDRLGSHSVLACALAAERDGVVRVEAGAERPI